MKLILVLLFIGIPFKAFATTKSEKSDFEKYLKELRSEISRAETDMGPCEGLDRLSELADRLNPPSSCTKAKKYFDSFQKNERLLKESCRKLNSSGDLHFRNQDYCASENAEKKMRAAKKEISNIKEKVSKEFDNDDDLSGIAYADISDEDYSKWKGEFSRIECAKPVIVAMQMRKIELMILSKYSGIHEMAADSIEDKSCRVNVENVFLYQRGGENALTPIEDDAQ